ncbi:hypothetical protein PoB_004575900 [Plakobranchus ocellatus]|uniref:Uncharacterized protein n=1 Tax=Plakobranchus ocellatus TaxID=259542 RepID=A0AAV4BK07_9GAST|nr:hypothetical protein PoB_004575900 [Plakobranchus ocellatus]
MATQAGVMIADPVARKCNDDKIACIGVDPYKIESEEKEVEEYPPIAYEDIFNYLELETSTYTQESFKIKLITLNSFPTKPCHHGHMLRLGRKSKISPL